MSPKSSKKLQWNFELPLEEKLYELWNLRLDQLPTDISFTPLKLRIANSPTKSDIEINFRFRDFNSNPETIRRHFATEIKKYSYKRLFDFYHESGIVFIKRKDQVGDDWNKLHAYDVQSAYKFLEAAYELEKQSQYVISPSGGIETARDWLISAHGQDKEIIDKGISIENYREILSLTDPDSLKAQFLGTIWRLTAELDSCTEKSRKMKELRDAFSRDRKILDELKLSIAVVQSSLNQAVVICAKNNEDEQKREFGRGRLKEMLAETNVLLAQNDDQKLNSDKIVLENLIEGLNEQ